VELYNLAVWNERDFARGGIRFDLKRVVASENDQQAVDRVPVANDVEGWHQDRDWQHGDLHVSSTAGLPRCGIAASSRSATV